MEEIILASGSPRRKELLSLIGVPFKVIKSDVEEETTQTDPGLIVEELSGQKAEDVASRIEEGTVLGADTIVWAEGEVMGKPKDEEDARRMLKILSGKAHSVFTGVTLIHKYQLNGEPQMHGLAFHRETKVHVHEMTDAEIDAYIASGEPFDKAGAYGIQGSFMAYVDGIEGDYQTVVGLPVSAVYQALKQLQEL